MVAGLGLPRALKLVAAALVVELVVILHPRMAARIVSASQPAHATCKPVQVRVVSTNESVVCLVVVYSVRRVSKAALV